LDSHNTLRLGASMRILLGVALAAVFFTGPVAQAQQAGMNVALPTMIPKTANPVDNPTPSCMEGFDPLQAAADIAIEAVAGVAASHVFALANTIPGFGQAFGAVVAGIAYQAVSDVL